MPLCLLSCSTFGGISAGIVSRRPVVQILGCLIIITFVFAYTLVQRLAPRFPLFVASKRGTVSLALIYNNHYHNSNDPAPQYSSILTAEAIV